MNRLFIIFSWQIRDILLLPLYQIHNLFKLLLGKSLLRKSSNSHSSVINRLIRYVFLASHALINKVLLPPLPIYWDQLAKCDWDIWELEDYVICSIFPNELSRQIKLNIVASFSKEHESLYCDFLGSAKDDPKPPRPRWI
jgi:hypothetical protein